MDERNKLEYVAQKYKEAVIYLAKSPLSRGEALSQLFWDLSFDGFTHAGIHFQNIPEECKEYFDDMNKILDKMHEDMFAEREEKTKINPELKSMYNVEINTRTALAKLDDKTAVEIISNICDISSVLERLKNK